MTVLHPLNDVAMHIVQTEGIGRKRAYRRRVKPLVTPGRQGRVRCFGAVIRVLVAVTRTPRVGTGRLGTRRVLPFRFGQQAIYLARPLT